MPKWNKQKLNIWFGWGFEPFYIFRSLLENDDKCCTIFLGNKAHMEVPSNNECKGAKRGACMYVGLYKKGYSLQRWTSFYVGQSIMPNKLSTPAAPALNSQTPFLLLSNLTPSIIYQLCYPVTGFSIFLIHCVEHDWLNIFIHWGCNPQWKMKNRHLWESMHILLIITDCCEFQFDCDFSTCHKYPNYS